MIVNIYIGGDLYNSINIGWQRIKFFTQRKAAGDLQWRAWCVRDGKAEEIRQGRVVGKSTSTSLLIMARGSSVGLTDLLTY